MMSDSVSGFLV